MVAARTKRGALLGGLGLRPFEDGEVVVERFGSGKGAATQRSVVVSVEGDVATTDSGVRYDRWTGGRVERTDGEYSSIRRVRGADG